MVEVFGLVEGIVVADECLKTANINLLGIEKVSRSGLVAVKITGDVGSITSAIEIVKKTRNVISTSIIPNIDNYAFEILKDDSNNFFKKSSKNNENLKSINSQNNKNSKNNDEICNIELNSIEEQNTPNKEFKSEEKIFDKTKSIEINEVDKEDGLQQKTVKELIEILVKSKKSTYKEAKKLRKEEIIKKIRN